MLKPSLLCLAAVILTACAVTSDIRPEQPLNQSLRGFNTIAVFVEKGAAISDAVAFEKVKESLAAGISSKLSTRTNLRVVDTPGETDLKLLITVTDLEYTSQGGRVMAGIMSGRAKLQTRVELTNTKSGAMLWRATTDATSSNAHGVFGGSTTTQVEALSNQLSTEIERGLQVETKQ